MAGGRGHAGRDDWWGFGPPRDWHSCVGCHRPLAEAGHWHETPYPVVFLCCRCFAAWEARWRWLAERGVRLPECCPSQNIPFAKRG